VASSLLIDALGLTSFDIGKDLLDELTEHKYSLLSFSLGMGDESVLSFLFHIGKSCLARLKWFDEQPPSRMDMPKSINIIKEELLQLVLILHVGLDISILHIGSILSFFFELAMPQLLEQVVSLSIMEVELHISSK
jgi:hypothetical protein